MKHSATISLPINILKKTMTLASGIKADCAIIRVENFAVENLNQEPPDQWVSKIAGGLAQGRLECPCYAVPHPADRIFAGTPQLDFGHCLVEAWAERVRIIYQNYINSGLLPGQLWQSRRNSAQDKLPVPLAPTNLLRLRSADLADHQILTNANHFLFLPREFDSPFEAYGDPVGMVISKGTMLHPPQVPRASLLAHKCHFTIANPAFCDIAVVLPDDTQVMAHRAGPYQPSAAPQAIARYYGSMDGLSALDDSAVEIVVVGRYAVALGRGGGLPIPRTGCILRFAAEPDAALLTALRNGAPVTYRLLNGSADEGVQSGPRLVSQGAIIEDEAAFLREGVFIQGVTGDLSQPSPYDWHADWHATRAARLGAGIDAEGRLFLVAIEGQSSFVPTTKSLARSGATLHDLAELLQRCGAREALHLDGGGSTQIFMPYGGAVLRPGDFHPGYPQAAAAYDRPLPLGLRIDVAKESI